MLCTRCLRGIFRTTIHPHTAQSFKFALTAASRRTFLTRPFLRPSILPSLSSPTSTIIPLTPTTTTTTTAPLPDLLPKVSTHPSLAGIQVRNGPRNTYDPSHFVRKRRHGFLARKRSRTGRAILLRRRAKRRGVLSH